MAKTFNVSRLYSITQYCEVEAETEAEAIEMAKELSEDCWEENPNDCFRDYYEYNAEECD